MSQQDDSGVKTFQAAGTIPKHARVVLGSGGTVTVAGLAEKEIGTALARAVSGENVAVKLRTAPGTHKMIAIEAMAIGAAVYTETDGKVQDTAQQTAFLIGTVVDIVAPTADGDIVEILYNAHGDTAVP